MNEEPTTHSLSWVLDVVSTIAQTELIDGGDFFGNGAVITVTESSV